MFYNEKLFVQREKMGIFCIKKTSDFVNLLKNVPWKVLEYLTEL